MNKPRLQSSPLDFIDHIGDKPDKGMATQKVVKQAKTIKKKRAKETPQVAPDEVLVHHSIRLPEGESNELIALALIHKKSKSMIVSEALKLWKSKSKTSKEDLELATRLVG